MGVIKDGKKHIASLRDGRDVILRGEKVTDVTQHPAYRQSVASFAALYDFQAAPENIERMTVDIGGGKRVSRAWDIPRSYDDMVKRRQALESWAELHYGFMGRSPDHVASSLMGMFIGAPEFDKHDPARGSALRGYWEHARQNDLFLTYVIIHPQADRSKAASEQGGQDYAVRIVDEDSSGLTVRGAKMLGTSCIMANEIFCASLQPLRSDEPDLAVAFSAPLNARGLKILSRKSYEEAAPSVFDNPLSSRFDENDAVIFFDDVKISWDRVFCARDVALSNKMYHATPAHIFQNYQAQIRLAVKLRFLVGLARRIAEANGAADFPQVREVLGQLAAEASMVDALVAAMEARGELVNGFFTPHRNTVYTAQVLTQQLYPKIINTLRDLSGGGVIMLPSGVEDLLNREVAHYALAAQRSPILSPEDRVRFFKLAWDAIGSEFASRHTQYEMFYAGASFVTKGHAYRTFDWERAGALVDSLWNSYPRGVDGFAQEPARKVGA